MNAPDLSTAKWRKASRSAHEGGDCVEVTEIGSVIAVRDSKNPDGPKLTFAATEWRTFTHRIRNEQFG